MPEKDVLPDASLLADAAPRQRAQPLSPDDRKAMIIDAVIPLLIEYGRCLLYTSDAADEL